MAKKMTPEQQAQYDAVKAAKAKPEKHFHLSRRGMHYFGDDFGMWTDWNQVSMGWGTPDVKFHGPEVPEDRWTIWFRIWKPALVVHNHLDRTVCWGW
jgi:hypothetical protein